MKIRSIFRGILVLVLLVGIGLFLYPYVSQFFYDRSVSSIVQSFEEDAGADNSLLDSLYQKMLEENRLLYENGQKNLTDPFAFEQSGIDLTHYGLNDNIVGYISIPKMDVVLPIYLGASAKNMELGAVHLTQTSYPVGGADSNSVIAAHRGYRKALMFRKIELLEAGDSVEIRNFRETLTYHVAATKVIYPNDINEILIQPQKDLVTLVTCHPFPGNKMRYLVFCRRSE